MQYSIDLRDFFLPSKQCKPSLHNVNAEGKKKQSAYGDDRTQEEDEEKRETLIGSDDDLIFPDQVDLEDD